MATYKVIQDVEAEDKLVGPLTLKQFIYAAIAGVLIFINFRVAITPSLGIARWVLMFFFSLPMILFGVLAAPLGGDQPTELWLLSHIKFLLRPRQRTWDQEGIVHSVTVTAPKRADAHLVKNLNQGEVQSRLKALATMLDSRGWAIQSTPLYQPQTGQVEDADRLVSSDTLPQTIPNVDVRDGDDVLDEQSSATAQRYGALVKEVEDQKRQDLADKLEAATKPDTKAKAKPAQNWDVQNISPLATQTPAELIIEPEGPAAFDINQAPAPSASKMSEAMLGERFKQAEEAMRAQHLGSSEASPLTAERHKRAARRLMLAQQYAKANLASSGNFSVSTISAVVNRNNEQQVPL